MKTSNKIVLVFFILVFLTPIFVLMSFKSKIRNGEFTSVKDEPFRPGNGRGGKIEHYKVIKFVAPDGKNLKCNLEFADSASYTYLSNGNRSDSLKVSNLGDTLLVEFTSDNGHNKFQSELEVWMKLPVVGQLIIENAEVKLLTADTSRATDLNVDLINGGKLKIGGREEGFEVDQKADPKFSFGQATVHVLNGELLLGGGVGIHQLNLMAEGRSVITIEDGANLDQISGRLSDNSALRASWKYTRKFNDAVPAK
jgi:hypothetical protein